MKRARRSAVTIFVWPLAVGALSVAGLVAGLMGEGGWDWLAWTGLALPVAIAWRAR